MDALPPVPIHCEAPTQAVQMSVNGDIAQNSYSAFVADLSHSDGDWTLVSDTVLAGKRTLVFRAHASVTYDAVTDATENAKLRGWTTRVTFEEPRCTS
jgi:hypothetical protein